MVGPYINIVLVVENCAGPLVCGLLYKKCG